MMLHERSLYLANSPWQVVYYYLFKQQGLPQTMATNLTIALSTCLFVASVILLSLWIFNFRPKRWRLPNGSIEFDNRRLWEAVTAASLLYLVVGAFWFQHWYLLWVLAPAALLPGSTFTRNFLPWLSFGGLMANLGTGYLLKVIPKKTSSMRIYMLTLVMIWMPGLIALMSCLPKIFQRIRHHFIQTPSI